MNQYTNQANFYQYNTPKNNNSGCSLPPPQPISERNGPRPIVVPGNPWPDYIIVFISIFLILLAFTYIIYLIKNTPPNTNARRRCALGLCITNIYTGEKICPQDSTTSLDIDPTFETCNSPFACESTLTPYALRSDGSTNNFGACEPGVQCRCLQLPQCANHVTAYFQVSNGSAFTGIDSQPIVFSQVNDYIDSQGVFFNTPPLRYDNTLTQFCEISREFVGLKVSGTDPDAKAAGGNRTYPQVEPNAPCLRGVLAYVPENVAEFNAETIIDTPLSCVQGDPCPKGQTPYWNNIFNRVTCTTIE